MKCPNCGHIIEKDARNLSQNALFHLWIKVLAHELGYISLNDVKRDVKREIIGTIEVVNKLTGEVGYEDYQTSKMTKREMADFMDKIKIWAQTEQNIYLPYIHEEGYEDMVNIHNK